MSIQTELTRITNAKASIAAAIAGKGVTVPDGTLLDGMAALIESIEAGGGGAKVAQGSFTLASDSKSYTIHHGLGDVPDFFVLLRNYSYTKTSGNFLSSVYITEANNSKSCIVGKNTSGKLVAMNITANIASSTYEDEQCIYGATQDTVNFGSNTFSIKAGVPCYWFAAKTGHLYTA